MRPGPLVTATASTSAEPDAGVGERPLDVGTIASRCARLATSGTTPPNRACSSTLEATASASRVVPADDADAGLVAGRLDPEHQRLVAHASPSSCGVMHQRVRSVAGLGSSRARTPIRSKP